MIRSKGSNKFVAVLAIAAVVVLGNQTTRKRKGLIREDGSFNLQLRNTRRHGLVTNRMKTGDEFAREITLPDGRRAVMTVLVVDDGRSPKLPTTIK